MIAEFVAAASATDEFTDRWRTPGDRVSKLWEERFGENRYIALGQEALVRAMKAAGVESGDIGRLAITGMHGRAVAGLAKKLALGEGVAADDLGSSVGQSGTAHPLLVLASTLEALAAEGAPAGTVVVAVHLADGADAVVLRGRPRRSKPGAQGADGGGPGGGRRRRSPTPSSSPGAASCNPSRHGGPSRRASRVPPRTATRSGKFGFVGSKRPELGGSCTCRHRGCRWWAVAVDDMEPVPMADAVGTVVTYTVDRLAYSPSPPIVFAIVDFDGGGRFPVELTDTDADEVRTGSRVEMTFRRLFSADGIHDYFWKGRLVRDGTGGN